MVEIRFFSEVNSYTGFYRGQKTASIKIVKHNAKKYGNSLSDGEKKKRRGKTRNEKEILHLAPRSGKKREFSRSVLWEEKGRRGSIIFTEPRRIELNTRIIGIIFPYEILSPPAPRAVYRTEEEESHDRKRLFCRAKKEEEMVAHFEFLELLPPRDIFLVSEMRRIRDTLFCSRHAEATHAHTNSLFSFVSCVWGEKGWLWDQGFKSPFDFRYMGKRGKRRISPSPITLAGGEKTRQRKNHGIGREKSENHFFFASFARFLKPGAHMCAADRQMVRRAPPDW